jgi:hypothetical protein
MNASARKGIPLVPSRPHLARATLASLSRTCVAIGVGGVDRHQYPQDVLQRLWPDDREAELLLKASSEPPASTTSASVAALLRVIIPSFFETLSAASAGAQLFGRGLALSFGDAFQITLPALIASNSYAGFTAEGAPIPVGQPLVESPIMLKGNKKLASIIVLTRELLVSSNAERLMSDLLIKSVALSLDAVLFDANPATGTRPAGLRNGITALTATPIPAGGSAMDAMWSDIENLLAAVSPISAEPPVLVASPARAWTMVLRAPHKFEPLTVLGSSAVAASDLICIAPAAFASATGSAPTIENSPDTLLNMETNPAAIIGAGPTFAVPVRSTWQTDSVALKLRLPTDWALRDPRGLSWLNTSAW